MHNELSLVERALKKPRVAQTAANSGFVVTRFMLRTSKVVERLMSTAGWCMTDHRQSTTPVNLEQSFSISGVRNGANTKLVKLMVR